MFIFLGCFVVNIFFLPPFLLYCSISIQHENAPYMITYCSYPEKEARKLNCTLPVLEKHEWIILWFLCVLISLVENAKPWKRKWRLWMFVERLSRHQLGTFTTSFCCCLLFWLSTCWNKSDSNGNEISFRLACYFRNDLTFTFNIIEHSDRSWHINLHKIIYFLELGKRIFVRSRRGNLTFSWPLTKSMKPKKIIFHNFPIRFSQHWFFLSISLMNNLKHCWKLETGWVSKLLLLPLEIWYEDEGH